MIGKSENLTHLLTNRIVRKLSDMSLTSANVISLLGFGNAASRFQTCVTEAFFFFLMAKHLNVFMRIHA